MKFHILAWIVVVVWVGPVPRAQAQTDYTLTIEAFTAHTTPYPNMLTGVPDNLNGMTTYRFYVNMLNPTDFLSSVYGIAGTPMLLNTTTGSFYNHLFATGADVGGISAAFLGFAPGLNYDSYVTIGLTSSAVAPASNPNLVESAGQPWKPNFTVGTPTSGQNVRIDDSQGGAWFVLNGSPNGYPTGPAMRVLVLQLTTAGVPHGVMNVQIFPQSVGANEFTRTFVFSGEGTFSHAPAVFGCLDPTACNFDAAANMDSGSCAYAAQGFSCSGTCILDIDADGVCDPLEVFGCTHPLASNFNPAATEEDGSCVFPCANCAPVFLPAISNSTVACVSELPSVPPVREAFNPCTGDTLEVVSMLIASSNNPCTGFRRFRHLALNEECANFTAVIEQISVSETSAPELVSVPVGLVLACDAAPEYGEAIFTDACTPFTIAYAEEALPGTCPSSFSLVRTATATDVCGNVGTASYVIQIIDTVAPEWATFPPDEVLACGDPVPSVVPLVEDQCSSWTLEESITVEDGLCPGSSVVFRAFTATDACGNANHRVQQVNFNDTAPPGFDSVPVDITVECTSALPEEMATAFDGCGPVSVEFVDTWESGDCLQEGWVHRTFVATDGCGNTTSVERIISVVDTTGPVIVGPPLASALCSEWAQALIEANDACGSVEVTFNSTPLQLSEASGGTVRVYTATDACGNASTAVQLVNYSDLSCGGCTDPFASNYAPEAVFNDGSCIPASTSCPEDFDLNGVVGTNDLLLFLSVFESSCP
jgi:hypothetical protein